MTRPLVHALRAALLAALLAACGASRPPPAAEGQTCARDAECASGLVCKASQCGPLRSRPGRPCVSAGGCEAGLECLGGRCSAGLAPEPMCRGACRQMQVVFRKEALSELQNVAEDGTPQPLRPEDEALLEQLAGADFAARCMERCLGLTREQALCLQEVRSVAEIQLCQ